MLPFEVRAFFEFANECRPFANLPDSLAAFLGCRRDELARVRNATEGNNIVCNGLDMRAGEEAHLTDREHPGGVAARGKEPLAGAQGAHNTFPKISSALAGTLYNIRRRRQNNMETHGSSRPTFGH
jgi:hypothetical protein